MLRRQRSAPASAPGSGISLYDRGSCRGSVTQEPGTAPCPGTTQGMEATLAPLWAKPLGCSFIPRAAVASQKAAEALWALCPQPGEVAARWHCGNAGVGMAVTETELAPGSTELG